MLLVLLQTPFIGHHITTYTRTHASHTTYHILHHILHITLGSAGLFLKGLTLPMLVTTFFSLSLLLFFSLFIHTVLNLFLACWIYWLLACLRFLSLLFAKSLSHEAILNTHSIHTCHSTYIIHIHIQHTYNYIHTTHHSLRKSYMAHMRGPCPQTQSNF